MIVSWPGCTIESPALDVLSRSLRRPDLFRDARGRPLVERVVTGREALAGLMDAPLRLRRDEAILRLRGTLIGPDAKTTCAVVTLTPAGLAERGRVVDLIRAGLVEHCQIPLDSLHLGGPVVDGLMVDRASGESLDRYAVPSAICSFFLCWWCLKWLPGALLVFGLSLYCEGATLALIHLSGDQISALLIVLPPLIQVVTVSGGIHLINYYLDAQVAHGRRGGLVPPATHGMAALHAGGRDHGHRPRFAGSERFGADSQLRRLWRHRHPVDAWRRAGFSSRDARGLAPQSLCARRQ